MFNLRRLHFSYFLVLCLVSVGFAQGDQKANPTSATVTASATAERVRFTAPSNVVRMQLQVVSESGQILFEATSKGNVFDWSLQDSTGQRLQGPYLTVVTVKSLSGKLSERIGSVSVEQKQVELRPVDATQLPTAQQQVVGPIEENAALTILHEGEAEATTVLANNGSDGQIVRDRGALSFRIGNFFSGTDEEQMRLTADGNLGIGTSKPKARLDVGGTIRAREGFQFADGSTLNVNDKGGVTLTSAGGNVVPNASGSGTQNRLAKWTDSSGTLGDSVALDTGTGLQLTAAPNPSVDTNLVYLNSTNGTTGVLAGSTPSYGANNGPFFAMRGNTYSTIANQRGLFTIAAGNIASPAGDDGSVKFNTGNDLLRMVIRPSGNVGIGTSNPGSLLDVGGNINTSTQYNIGGTRILSAPGINNAFVGVGAGNLNTTGQQNSLFGASAGSLNTMGNRNSLFGSQAGVVTTNGANSFFGYSAGVQNSTGAFNSFFGDSAGNQNVDGNNNTAIGYGTNLGSSSLTNATAIGALAQVDAHNSLVLGSIYGVNGAVNHTKVGIGVTAPLATLHVKSFNTSLAENTATFQAPNLGANPSHIHYGATGDWLIRSASGSGKVILQDTGGNVGIGTGTPALKLDVRDGTGAGGNGGHVQIGAQISGNDEKIIVFGDSGCTGPCVFIGEQEADDRMVLGAGSFRFKFGNVLPYSNNGQTLGSSSNKWAEVWAVNGTIQTSDARLKQGIANLKYGLNQVMQLRPVSFQWRAGNDKRTHLGLIAQEVDAVLPEAVQKSADPNAPLGMNYSDLIPVLIKAIQEQQRTLERTQAELKAMRAKNEGLSRRIISLEATTTVAKSIKKAQ